MAISAAPLTRNQLGAATERGLRMSLFQGYNLRTDEGEELYNNEGSEKAQETDQVFAGLDRMVQTGEGTQITYDNGGQAYTKVYQHLKFALGYKWTIEAQQDDLMGISGKFMNELGMAAKKTRAVERMRMYNNTSDVQYVAGGTSYGLLSSTHFRLDDGTWSNVLASGADLTIESLELALIAWRQQMVDQRGFPVNIKPKYLLHGTGNEINALRILNSMYRPNTDLNDENVVRRWNLEPLCATHLTNDGRWFLVAAPADNQAYWFDRQPLRMDRDTDVVGTLSTSFVAWMRFSSGITSPLGQFGSL